MAQSFVVQRTIDAAIAEVRAERKAQTKFKLWTEDKAHTITVRYAPRSNEVAGLTRSWDTTERPMRAPLLVQGSNSLVQFNFEFMLGHRDWTRSVEQELQTLRYIARSTQRVFLQFGPHEGVAAWRVTDFGYTIDLRREGDNAVTRATVQLQLTQASDLKLGVGPVTGGKKAPATNTSGTAGSKQQTTRYYIVKSGDTMASISLKFYNTTRNAQAIADANKIRNVNNIAIGQRLVIP